MGTLAIIGRPNVGKSTLFNRLVGKRLALVDDMPGVTRDRKEGQGLLYDLTFTVIDTAGLEESFDDSLEARMRRQTERAVAEADVVLFLFDARAGLLPQDKLFADWLRKIDAPVVVAANKCEGHAGEAGRLEAYRLGLGEVIPLSAEHGLGLADLHEAIKPFLADKVVVPEDHDEAPSSDVLPHEGGDLDDDDEDRLDDGPIGPLQVAVVGRPNVGKSTLVNRLLGDERLLTGPEAGITRDAITIPWFWRGREFRLVDTAGLRRRARISQGLEHRTGDETRHAINFAQVVILVLDAGDGLDKQDLTIARQVLQEGRVLVIALNKWDACTNKKEVMGEVIDRLERSLPQAKGIALITISGLRGHKLDELMAGVEEGFALWNKRVPTATLNRWLANVTEAHPPPAVAGRRLKLKYMTQAKTRPPTFVISCTRPKDVPESYLRYMENLLRADFHLPGIPLRLHMKGGSNPYADKKRR